MTLRSFWAIIRKWIVIVTIGAVLAIATGAAIALVTPVRYSVSASYLFLSPVRGAPDGKAGNPFLQLGNGVAMVIDVISVGMTDGNTVRQYTKPAPALKYTVVRDTAVSAPIMVIKVDDVDQARAVATLTALGTDVADRLNTIQRDAAVPEILWITANQLTRDPEIKVDYGDPIRNGFAALLAVLGVTLVVVAIAERRQTRRDALVEATAPRKHAVVDA